MSRRAPLLIEIGCEEIPARMVAGAAADLTERVVRALDQAGLGHGAATHWGGPRRLAVRVEDVEAGQPDREEQVLGPSAAVAFADGGLTAAALGFARKQGIDPDRLSRVATPRGEYVGFDRRVAGREVAELLADGLPALVAAMSFPKTMRWADGRHRWVRPVHWLLALHGGRCLPVRLFDVPAGVHSAGHRFLSVSPVEVRHADAYLEALEAARVIADPARRRAILRERLAAAAGELGGSLVEDPGLLDEAADIVEWPGVVSGGFDAAFLDLPRELLVTTLRHHQKCFSVADPAGGLMPRFLAVTNMDADRAGHIRRGNEWVVGGRLEDARFFWNEDRKLPLEARGPQLAGVGFHGKLGSYREKAERMAALAARVAEAVGLPLAGIAHCRAAALAAKCDLVTGTVGEFPELQGRIGGLLLRAEGQPEAVWRAVYEHYRPEGPADPVPETIEGAVIALADKLDNVASFVRIGEVPTGSRDPFALRRATNGLLRIVLERKLPLSLSALDRLAGGVEGLPAFLRERLTAFLRDAGFTPNEILAVLRPRVSETELLAWELHDIAARLAAIRTVRGRADFFSLVKLTERVDTILARNAERVSELARGLAGAHGDERDPAALALARRVADEGPALERDSRERAYERVVDRLAGFIEPVERFFADVLVIDEKDAAATCRRVDLLGRLRGLLTRYFDIRELAGQAERRA